MHDRKSLEDFFQCYSEHTRSTTATAHKRRFYRTDRSIGSKTTFVSRIIVLIFVTRAKGKIQKQAKKVDRMRHQLIITRKEETRTKRERNKRREKQKKNEKKKKKRTYLLMSPESSPRRRRTRSHDLPNKKQRGMNEAYQIAEAEKLGTTP